MARLARVHGALIIDKPEHWTSHDVVAKARGIYGQKRVGHGGTLDPMARGVLILLLGEATKLSPYVAAATKEYEAQIDFGVSTNTLDADGDETERAILSPGWLTSERLETALNRERARTEQVPPAFSAIKVQGRTAYSMARKGQELELAARNVEVEALELLEASDTSASLRLRVSKGYYVRSMAHDICQSLGVPGHLSALLRTQSGPFRIEAAHRWPLEGAVPLIDLATLARRCLSVGVLSAEGRVLTGHGKPLHEHNFEHLPPGAAAGEPFAWFDNENQLLAIGQRTAEGVYRVSRGFQGRQSGAYEPQIE